MHPRDLAYLEDIRQGCLALLRFSAGLDEDSFLTSEMARAAVMYEILIMGEACKRLSSDYRTAHPEIDWRNMGGMRDRLIHEYDRVDMKQVWKTISERVPELLPQLETLIAEAERESGYIDPDQ